MTVYKKLVRDRIPEIIKNNGQTAVTKILSIDEYKLELQRKSKEERGGFEDRVFLIEVKDD